MDKSGDFWTQPTIWNVLPVLIALIALYFGVRNFLLSKWKQQRDDYVTQFKSQTDIDDIYKSLTETSIADTYRSALDTLNVTAQVPGRC